MKPNHKNVISLDDYQSMGIFVVETTKHSFNRLKELNQEINSNLARKNSLNDVQDLVMDAYVYRNDIITRIVAFFETDPRMISLPDLDRYLRKEHPELALNFSANLSSLQSDYQLLLKRLKKNRNGAIAHFGKEPLNEVLIEAQELLSMPIINLLDEIGIILASLLMDRALKSSAEVA